MYIVTAQEAHGLGNLPSRLIQRDKNVHKDPGYLCVFTPQSFVLASSSSSKVPAIVQGYQTWTQQYSSEGERWTLLTDLSQEPFLRSSKQISALPPTPCLTDSLTLARGMGLQLADQCHPPTPQTWAGIRITWAPRWVEGGGYLNDVRILLMKK